jgi:hypothetical protein
MMAELIKMVQYHANIWTTNPAIKDSNNVQQMDFLLVRWFGGEPDYRYGFCQACLPKVGFVESSDDYAFGFLNLRHVVCGCHLICAFQGGHTFELLPMKNSAARILEGDMVADWENFYVNSFKVKSTHISPLRFADHDLLMQHLGGDVGHINNTVDPSVDSLSDMDIDNEEEVVVSSLSTLDSQCNDEGQN